MPNTKALIPMSEVVTQVSMADLCRICGSSADWIIELVDEGILEPDGRAHSSWRFQSSSITVVQKVQRLQSDLRINIPGVAVVLSLSDENAKLKQRLKQLEHSETAIWLSDEDI